MFSLHATDSAERNVQFAVHLAVVGGQGQVFEARTFDYLAPRIFKDEDGRVLRNWTNKESADRESRDQREFSRLLAEYRPEVVLVAAASMKSRRLFELLNGSRLLAAAEDGGPVHVLYTDSSYAELFVNSDSGRVEFPELSSDLRLAVSNGRYFLDPLGELAYLSTTDLGIVNVASVMSEEFEYYAKLKRRDAAVRLGQCFQSAYYKVYVDANLPTKFRKTKSSSNGVVQRCAAAFAFLPGLGPRKARALVEGILRRAQDPRKGKDERAVNTREELGELLGEQRVVAQNLLGFVLISHGDFQLDEMRLPLALYPTVGQILEVANDYRFDYKKHIKFNRELKVFQEKFQDTREARDKIAREVKERCGIPVLSVVDMLKHGFAEPLEDVRRPKTAKTVRDVPPKELFYMLINCPKSTFEGSAQTFIPTRVGARDGGRTPRVAGRLDNGVYATLSVWRPGVEVKAGVPMPAFVKSVDEECFRVSVDTKPPEVSLEREMIGIAKRHFTVGDTAYTDFEREQRELEHTDDRQRVLLRTFKHSNFTNDWSEAEKLKAPETPNGTVRFFPSTKRRELFAVWKVYADITLTTRIREREDPDDPAKLGSELELFGETCEDLDEVVDRIYGPMNRLVAEIAASSKFRQVDEREMQGVLEAERHASQSTPYRISFSRRHAGLAVLSLLTPSNGVLRFYIAIRPQGLQFDHYRVENHPYFSSIDSIVNYFKRHFREITDYYKSRR